MVTMCNQKEIDVENPYLDVFRKADGARNYAIMSMRFNLRQKYAFAVPTFEVIRTIVAENPRIVEIGAGNGYWAWMLEQAGAEVFPYDTDPLVGHHDNKYFKGTHQWVPVMEGGPAFAADHPDCALLLCWPPMSSMAYDAVMAYTGNTLWYIGEGDGGCTADESFFDELGRNWEYVESYQIPQWWGINDGVTLYRRKK
jgi:hypothetical protein